MEMRRSNSGLQTGDYLTLQVGKVQICAKRHRCAAILGNGSVGHFRHRWRQQRCPRQAEARAADPSQG